MDIILKILTFGENYFYFMLCSFKKEFNSYTPPDIFVNDVYFLFDTYVKKNVCDLI